MRIVETYSHQGAEEILHFHQPELWQEISDAVVRVDAESCRTKVSRERNRTGSMLYSPRDMNLAFKAELNSRGWDEQRVSFWVANDKALMQRIWRLPPDEQKRKIEERGLTPISTYNQTDYVKDRVAIEVQFGKYAFVAHDIFVKHMSFYTSEVIDLGIEILPMKELERQMSSGVPYFERDMLNLLRQNRAAPMVPIMLIGVAP